MQRDGGAAALLRRPSDEKFLLQQRSENAHHNPGLWGCFGGGIESGETPEQALARELMEEIEYEVRNPKLILTTKRIEGEDTVISYLFLEEYDETHTIVLHEGQGYGWFTFKEALKLGISDNRRKTLKKIQKFLLACA